MVERKPSHRIDRNLVKELFAYLDDEGYPGTVNHGQFDGGDTASIVGTILALQRLIILPSGLLYELVDINGIPRRHPDTTKWYGQPDRFSRDQLIPLICAGIVLQHHVTIDVIFNAHRRRNFLTAWNTKKNGVMETPDKFPDITGPEVWALWIRYKRPKWAHLVLWFLDIETLLGSIKWRWFTSMSNRVTRNHMLVCLTARTHMPTLTMRLAFWLNDWGELITRWAGHCKAVGEIPTADLFRMRVSDVKKDG